MNATYRLNYGLLTINWRQTFMQASLKELQDPWMAVNASSHYRKCDRAMDADLLLDTINVEQQKTPKLSSALCTTHGGVKRDLKEFDKGLHLGEKAHALTPDHYHPCTLLGAIYMELGNYELGQKWYANAVERGATVDSVDRDIRKIYRQLGHHERGAMKSFLQNDDSIR